MGRTGAGFHVSSHAVQRALEMGVPGEEIRECFDNPTDTYFTVKHNAETRSRGRLALGVRFDVDMGMYVVTTVLWSTQEAWEADYQRGGTAPDRRQRTDLSHLKRTVEDA